MSSIAALTLGVLLLTTSAVAQEGERTVVEPEDTGAILCNPGMGWVLHYYDNVPRNYGSRLEPSDTLDDWPGLTVIYLRIPWSYVEPAEGEFNWSVVDTPAQRWIDKGKQVAFRFSCTESWMRYATPEWVQKAGASGHNFTPGRVDDDGPFWEPDYDDPVFLGKLSNFLAAAAERYDGSPDVAFIDVGSFGVWGEGHTFASTRLAYSAETVKRHIDLHCKHFTRTLLAANDDFASQGRGQVTIDYACEKGLTLRDDSILVQGGTRAYFNADMAPAFWPNVPVVLESEHYGGSRDRGNWGDGSLYLKAAEDYHASYASIHWWPREFLNECRDLIARMSMRLGYRIQLIRASWDATVRVKGTLDWSATWRNAGVAPCLPGGFPAITLKDEKGGVAGVFVDESLDVRSLPVGPPGEVESVRQDDVFTLPFNLKPGTYSVYISVGRRDGRPTIALPLAGDDGHHRYPLGELRVRGDYAVQTAGPQREDDRWRLPATWRVHTSLPDGVRPFLHFERDGRIVFQGYPEEGPALAELPRPGTVNLPCTFEIPNDARGQSFEIKIGLWVPERIGRPDERMIPDHDLGDLRVLVGTLNVDENGDPSFTAPAGG